MCMSPPEIRKMFTEHDHLFALREYRARIIAHRLKKFGFEQHVNLLEPREMILMALFMEGHQRASLMNEAFDRLGLPQRAVVR